MGTALATIPRSASPRSENFIWNFILRNFVTDFVDRTRQLVLYHDVDLILGIFGRLQREYAFSDRIAPFAAVGELELLDLFFGQVGIVHHIEEEVLRPVLQLVDIDVLLFAGPAHEDIAAAFTRTGRRLRIFTFISSTF